MFINKHKFENATRKNKNRNEIQKRFIIISLIVHSIKQLIMNIHKIISIVFTTAFSLTLLGQEINLNEMVLIQAKDHASLNSFLTGKGWETESSFTETDDLYGNEIWTRQALASGKLIYSFANGNPCRVSYLTSQALIYNSIMAEAQQLGMKNVKSEHIRDCELIYFGNENFVLRLARKINDQTFKISLYEREDFKLMYNKANSTIDFFSNEEEISSGNIIPADVQLNIDEDELKAIESEFDEALLNLDDQSIEEMETEIASMLLELESSAFVPYKATVIGNGDFVELKEEPSENSETLSKIPKGTDIDVIEDKIPEREQWAKISFEDKKGYILNTQLRK